MVALPMCRDCWLAGWMTGSRTWRRFGRWIEPAPTLPTCLLILWINYPSERVGWFLLVGGAVVHIYSVIGGSKWV